MGKKQKFLTVVANLETAERLWFWRERKKETLDEFFNKELTAKQRRGCRWRRVDYPEGGVCPQCPFWAHRDRWTGDVIH